MLLHTMPISFVLPPPSWCTISLCTVHLLGGIHGEAACRQAQPCWHHDSEDHQGVDAVAQIPTPPQGHCPAAGSCQRPASSKVISFVLH